MIDEKRIERFIEGAKEAFKEVDDPTLTFPMNILSAYELATNIEELLKAQEPRVMTLEEVKRMKRLTICAVEQRSKVIKDAFNAEYGGIVTLGTENFLDFGLYGNTNRYRRTEARYGKSWRCWTARPTDEQRKEVKWE